MKGIVFTTLNEMVVEKFGLEAWEALIQTLKLPSGGCYTAGDTYPYEELHALVLELAKTHHIEVPTLLRAYGEYMFPVLAQKYPVFLQDMTFQSFLKSIENVIHVEVKKLYPDAGLPTIRYEEIAPDKIILMYHSPRKLCHLAEGLVLGAAKHFQVPVDISQPVCAHHGGKECQLEITLGKS